MIKYHTDSEITSFLQDKAEQGLAFKEVRGNWFYFEKKPYDNRRVCALTVYRFGNEFSTEIQVREELVRLRKSGWDCLAVGKQETLKDVQRHVYLKEEVLGSDLPLPNPRGEKRAQIRGKFKSISNLLLCALYSACLYILLADSLIRVVTSNPYIVCTALFAVLLAICCVLCVWAFLDAFFIRKNVKVLDLSTRLVSFLLLLLAIFLLVDSFAQDRGNFERVKIGSSTYRLYSDEIPVDLDNLGIDTSAPYRTTRHIKSESFISSYSYSFDESFGIIPGNSVYDDSSISGICSVKYTLFKSDNSFLRDKIASQGIRGGSNRDFAIEKAVNADYAYVSNSGEITLLKGSSVMMIDGGIEFGEPELKVLASLLD